MVTKHLCDRCGKDIPRGYHVIRIGIRDLDLCVKCYDEFTIWYRSDNVLHSVDDIIKSIRKLKSDMSDEICRIDKPLGILQIEQIIDKRFGNTLVAESDALGRKQE